MHISPANHLGKSTLKLVSICALCMAPAWLAAAETTTYRYDALGRLELVTKEDGTEIDYDYDAAGNRTSKDTSDGSGGGGGGPSNNPPNAVNDSVSISGLWNERTRNLVANDSDPDGDPLTIASITQPWNAFVVITSGGTSVLITSTDIGTGNFTYTVSDGRGGTDTATVTVTVTGNSGGPPIRPF